MSNAIYINVEQTNCAHKFSWHSYFNASKWYVYCAWMRIFCHMVSTNFAVVFNHHYFCCHHRCRWWYIGQKYRQKCHLVGIFYKPTMYFAQRIHIGAFQVAHITNKHKWSGLLNWKSFIESLFFNAFFSMFITLLSSDFQSVHKCKILIRWHILICKHENHAILMLFYRLFFRFFALIGWHGVRQADSVMAFYFNS